MTELNNESKGIKGSSRDDIVGELHRRDLPQVLSRLSENFPLLPTKVGMFKAENAVQNQFKNFFKDCYDLRMGLIKMEDRIAPNEVRLPDEVHSQFVKLRDGALERWNSCFPGRNLPENITSFYEDLGIPFCTDVKVRRSIVEKASVTISYPSPVTFHFSRDTRHLAPLLKEELDASDVGPTPSPSLSAHDFE